jgi:hypothetical protein
LQRGALSHQLLSTLGILPQIFTVDLAFELVFLCTLGIDLKDTPEGS